MVFVVGQYPGLPKHRQELEPGEFPGDFYVRPIVADIAAALGLEIGPFLAGDKVEIPFGPRSQFRCAVAEKRIATGLNLVREANDKCAGILTEPLNVRTIVRNVTKCRGIGEAKRASNSPPLQLPLCPPDSFPGDQER